MDLRRYWPIPLLLLIVALFHWKLTTDSGYTWIDHPDLLNQVAPWLQFQFRAWKEWTLPLWDPFLWAGYPPIGQVQPGVLNPMNILFFLLAPKRDFLSIGQLNWYLVLIHAVAAVCAYLMGRGLGRTQLASLACGILYGLGGFVGMTRWPQMAASAVLLPLVLLFLLRSLQGTRPMADAAMGGVLLGISLLGTHHNVPVFAGMAFAAVVLGAILSEPANRWQRAGAFAVFVLFAGAGSAAQGLPASEFGKLSLRWVSAPEPVTWNQRVPYSVHRDQSVEPADVVGLVAPGSKRPDIFAGLTGFALALLGLTGFREQRTVRYLSILGIVGIVLALGGASLYHGVAYALLPYVEKARSPWMAMTLTHLAICALAAFGIDSWGNEGAKRRAGNFLLVAGAIAALAVIIGRVFSPERGYSDLSLFFLSALALGCICRFRLPAILVPALMLWELYPVSDQFLRPATDIATISAWRDDAAFAAYLKPQSGRVQIDEEAIPYNFGDWFGVEQYNGYLAALSKDMAELHHHPRVMRMFRVEYRIAAKPSGDFQEAVFEGPRDLKIFRNGNVMPQAWTVHRTVRVSSDAEASAALLDDAVDLSAVAIVREELQVDACEGDDQATVADRKRNSLTLQVEMACSGLLVAGDAWFPGWTAKVNGQDSDLLRVNHLVRGVVVPAGKHTVVFRYRPWSLIAGLSVTLLAFAAAVGWRFWR